MANNNASINNTRNAILFNIVKKFSTLLLIILSISVLLGWRIYTYSLIPSISTHVFIDKWPEDHVEKLQEWGKSILKY